jgi:hypothetical protein
VTEREGGNRREIDAAFRGAGLDVSQGRLGPAAYRKRGVLVEIEASCRVAFVPCQARRNESKWRRYRAATKSEFTEPGCSH